MLPSWSDTLSLQARLPIKVRTAWRITLAAAFRLR
jgi:hypothetical protein